MRVERERWRAGRGPRRGAAVLAAYDDGGEALDVGTAPLLGFASVTGLEEARDGALVLAGSFQGKVCFGPEPLVSKGRKDAFVAKICR